MAPGRGIGLGQMRDRVDHPGIVDHHVDPAEARENGPDGRIDGAPIGHVAGQGHGIGADIPGKGRDPRRIAGDGNDMRALRSEGLQRGRADAPACPGNHDDFSRQVAIHLARLTFGFHNFATELTHARTAMECLDPKRPGEDASPRILFAPKRGSL